MRKFRTSARDAGQPLAAWLVDRLGIDREHAEELIRWGGVYVGRRREVRPEARLDAAATIVVHDPPPEAPPVSWQVVSVNAEVVVVEKPAGLASQATRSSITGLDRLVAAAYPDARLMHRLDRDASGLVLFARRGATGAFQAALATHALVREYAAVVAVRGPLAEASFTIDAPIGRHPRDPLLRWVGGGKPARTHVQIEQRRDGRALLGVRLETGRTHQIRVHLAHVDLPILGDRLYAPPDVAAAAPRLCLHCRRLAWPGGEATSPLPSAIAHIAPS